MCLIARPARARSSGTRADLVIIAGILVLLILLLRFRSASRLRRHDQTRSFLWSLLIVGIPILWPPKESVSEDFRMELQQHTLIEIAAVTIGITLLFAYLLTAGAIRQ